MDFHVVIASRGCNSHNIHRAEVFIDQVHFWSMTTPMLTQDLLSLPSPEFPHHHCLTKIPSQLIFSMENSKYADLSARNFQDPKC